MTNIVDPQANQNHNEENILNSDTNKINLGSDRGVSDKWEGALQAQGVISDKQQNTPLSQNTSNIDENKDVLETIKRMTDPQVSNISLDNIDNSNNIQQNQDTNITAHPPVQNQTDNTQDPDGQSSITEQQNSAPKQPEINNKPTWQQVLSKQWSKISFRTLAIGCGIFFLIFILLVWIAFYVALSNPSSLTSLGIDTENIKSILMIFTILFFGLLFFIWFGFAALNAYRFFTNKTGSRIKYAIWLFIWLVMFIWALGLWVLAYIKINWISDNKTYNTNDLVIAHLQVRKYDNTNPLPYGRVYMGTPGLKLIGPAYFDLQLNQPVFQNLTRWLNATFNRFIVDCGNWQTIVNDASQISSQRFMNGACLYLKKWTYQIKLTYDYFDNIQRVNQTRTINNAATIVISTDYEFNIDGWARELNDNKNEIIVWTAPTKLLLNAQKIFTDLNIPNINIYRDVDGDGQIDKQDRVNFTYYLNEPRLYDSYFSIPALQIPGIWPIYYLMRYRVNAWDVPVCDISYTKNTQEDNSYIVTINIDDKWTDISDYAFDIIDNKTDEIIRTIKSERNNSQITFPDGKEYRIRWYFNTAEWKRWGCEWDILDIGADFYTILTDISYIWPEDNEYIKLTNSWTFRLSWSNIILGDIPTTIKLNIINILPNIVDPQIKLFLGNELKNPIKENEYVLKIDNQESKILTIEVDDSKGKKSTKVYNIITEKQPLIWILKANNYVWFDPLVVEFDASISKLNDPTDEVVYFTWDFGDGEIRNNTSVWKIIHTYRFDTVKENGEYMPKVIIKTKKGITQEIPLDGKIIVKRAIRSFDIVSISHPTQIVNIWDMIDFAIRVDGEVKSITWDFGDGNKLNGPNREFIEASNVYKQIGTYNIYVTVEYQDSSPVTQSIKVIVN